VRPVAVTVAVNLRGELLRHRDALRRLGESLEQ
jgi:hypothetical protein